MEPGDGVAYTVFDRSVKKKNPTLGVFHRLREVSLSTCGFVLRSREGSRWLEAGGLRTPGTRLAPDFSRLRLEHL